MTKIDIISGFLGAGKTTLIKKLLDEAYQGEKIVLIENEFGEVGIDGGFLKDAGIEVSEMNSGCICCSLVGDFDKNLREVLERFQPDRILIEPSGVGKLSDVMKSITNISLVKGTKSLPQIELSGLVTVVNTPKLKKQMRAFGEFFNNQIENASTIVLSRTQDLEEEVVAQVVAMLREKNGQAVIITTPWEQLKGTQIVAAMEQPHSLADEIHVHIHDESCTCGCQSHHHDHHHADEIFTSWGIETPHKFTNAVIERALKELCENKEYGEILRAKGMVAGEDDHWIYFDLVDGEYELRSGQADYTGRLCVIGTDLAKDKLTALFDLV
jgi:G3E family GTPase